MVEILDLKIENPADYYEMLTRRGQESFDSEDGLVYGIRFDEHPAGAIAIEEDGMGAAVITSLFIAPEFRRKRLGTELVFMAASYLAGGEGLYRIEADFAENEKEEPGAKEFFEFLEFELEKDPGHGAFTVKISDVDKVEVISKASSAGLLPYNKIKSSIRNYVISEHPALWDVMAAGKIDQEVSCFEDTENFDGDEPDCIIFCKEGDELVMAWAQSENNKLNLVKMLKFAFDVAKEKYGSDMKVRIPYINEVSKKLILKMMGDAAVPSETVWRAVLPVDAPLDGEMADIEADLYGELA